jgi:hypothetical protein
LLPFLDIEKKAETLNRFDLFFWHLISSYNVLLLFALSSMFFKKRYLAILLIVSLLFAQYGVYNYIGDDMKFNIIDAV